MRHLVKTLGFCGVALLVATAPAAAENPLLHFEGLLADDEGAPLPTGLYCVEIGIWDGPDAGAGLAWGPERFDELPVSTGSFSAIVGGELPLTGVFASEERYFGVRVGDDCASLSAEILPRQRILPVPTGLAAESLTGAVRTGVGAEPSLRGFDGTAAERFALTGSSAGGALTLRDGSTGTSQLVGVTGAGDAYHYLYTAGSSTTRVGARYVRVYDNLSRLRARAEVNSMSAGFVQTQGPAGGRNTEASYFFSDPEYGLVAAFPPGPAPDGAALYVNPSRDAGTGTLRGANDGFNVFLTTLLTNPNFGAATVVDAGGTEEAGIVINSSNLGIVFGDTKNFVVDHPEDAGKKIVYISEESPEAVISFAGRGRLEGGRATIEIPEHFAALAAPDRVTVNVTPHSLESRGLAVAQVDKRQIVIGERFDGTGTYEFSYEIQGIRADKLDHRPVVAAAELNRAGGDRGTR